MSPQSNLLMLLASPVNTPFITLITNIFFTIFLGKKTHEHFINRTQTSSTSQDLRAQDLKDK